MQQAEIPPTHKTCVCGRSPVEKTERGVSAFFNRPGRPRARVPLFSGSMAAPSSESYVAPAPQPVEQAEVARPPTLVSGRVQHFRGYMTRQTTVLKRWKQNWIEIEPGKKWAGKKEWLS